MSYEYTKTVTVRLTVDKGGMLAEAPVRLEVLQEYAGGARGERIVLGTLKLNLAEYVEASEEGDEGVVRRYLMQNSKINSTLKVGVTMKFLEGDRTFTAPQLKTAPIFGGIAGIMGGDQRDSDSEDSAPALLSKTRDTGEMQDMYRRNMAAFWAAQPGELPADQCVEDIFAGGDGWAREDKSPKKSKWQSPKKKQEKEKEPAEWEIDELEARDDLKSWIANY